MKNHAAGIVIAAFAVAAAFFLGRGTEQQAVTDFAPVHRSYLQTREVFDRGFAEAEGMSAEKNVAGIIVSHHLLATRLIAESFLAASGMHPDTVIIVSPNHFSKGFAPVIISSQDWDTPYGPLAVDSKLADALLKNGAVADEFPFLAEHGISSIMPYVKKVFPNAEVLPIIVKESASVEDARAFGARLAELAPKNSLLVASFDFSHEVTNEEAERSDRVSLKAIQDFDYPTLAGIRVDSRPGLILSLAYMEARGTAFHLLESTNAAHLLRKLDMTDVTSYITGYFAPTE